MTKLNPMGSVNRFFNPYMTSMDYFNSFNKNMKKTNKDQYNEMNSDDDSNDQD